MDQSYNAADRHTVTYLDVISAIAEESLLARELMAKLDHERRSLLASQLVDAHDRVLTALSTHAAANRLITLF